MPPPHAAQPGPRARLGEKTLAVELSKVKIAFDHAHGAFILGVIDRHEHAELCRDALAVYVAAVSKPLVHTGGNTDAATQEDHHQD